LQGFIPLCRTIISGVKSHASNRLSGAIPRAPQPRLIYAAQVAISNFRSEPRPVGPAPKIGGRKLNKPPPHTLCSKFQKRAKNSQLAENKRGRQNPLLPKSKHDLNPVPKTQSQNIPLASTYRRSPQVAPASRPVVLRASSPVNAIRTPRRDIADKPRSSSFNGILA
jgi:hypothetical protein